MKRLRLAIQVALWVYRNPVHTIVKTKIGAIKRGTGIPLENPMIWINHKEQITLPFMYEDYMNIGSDCVLIVKK